MHACEDLCVFCDKMNDKECDNQKSSSCQPLKMKRTRLRVLLGLHSMAVLEVFHG